MPSLVTKRRAAFIGKLQWETGFRLRGCQAKSKSCKIIEINQKGCEVGERAASSCTNCVGE